MSMGMGSCMEVEVAAGAGQQATASMSSGTIIRTRYWSCGQQGCLHVSVSLRGSTGLSL